MPGFPVGKLVRNCCGRAKGAFLHSGWGKIAADADIEPQAIPILIERFRAVAADWESGAIAWVAACNGVRCLILRGVSDLVNPQAGEAYGAIEIFQQQAKKVMWVLFAALPAWIEKAIQS